MSSLDSLMMHADLANKEAREMETRNVPDDWDCHWRTCKSCGEKYHASGSSECACSCCVLCDELKPQDLMDGDACSECIDSCVWAWSSTHMAEELGALLDVLEEGYLFDGGPTEMLSRIELLQTTLKQVHKTLSEGFTAQ